jgi:hypothetical protein
VKINGKEVAVVGSQVTTCNDVGARNNSVVMAPGASMPMPVIINPKNTEEYNRERAERERKKPEITAARWSKSEVKEGEEVELSAEVKDIGDGNMVTFQIKVQGAIVKLKCLVKGATGIFQVGGENDTYCNHAAFLTVIATDGKYSNFTGKAKTREGMEYPFPDASDKDEYSRKNNGIRSSNFWYDELARLAREGLLVLLSDREAQLYGNMGYTVIGAYKATSPVDHPHYATVRPGFAFDEKYGPMVTNVGKYNIEEARARDERCFASKFYDDVKWYYNPKQEFRLDFAWIEHLQGRSK